MAPGVILRQLQVAGSLQLAALTVGVAVAFPGILLQQLKTQDKTIELDLNMASWIGSIHGLAGLPTVLMPIFMQWKGRKLAFIVSCLINLGGWILMYFAKSVFAILASECLLGLGASCILVVGLTSIAEMVAPKFRNMCMVTYYILETIGIGIAGMLGKYLYWRTISLITCFPLALATLVACTWPESPYWLAFIGEYRKSEKAFIYLRGADEKSKQELTDLILKNQENNITKRSCDVKPITSILKQVRQRDFYIPTFLIFVLLFGVYFSGVIVVIIYITDIMSKVTNKTEVIANIAVVGNMTFVVGASWINIMNKFFNTKTVILTNIVSVSTVALITSVVTYLQTISIISIDSYSIPLTLVYFYVVVVCCGTDSFTVAATLMPVKHKGLGGALFIIFTDLLHSSSLKLSPYLLVYGGVWVLYLTFGLNAIVCGVIIWKFLPETKGRTLQEIEEYYENFRFKTPLPILDTKSIN